MNKRIRKFNLKRGDEPLKPLTFNRPPPMDAGVKKQSLVTKEVAVDVDVNDELEDAIDKGDMELSNMIASIEEMDDEFICAGSAEVPDLETSDENNSDMSCQFMDDKDFITAPNMLEKE